MALRKSFIGKALLFLFCTHLVFVHQVKSADTEADLFFNGMYPGMATRLEQKTIDKFKKAMSDFAPHYINADLKLPSSYHYDFKMVFDVLTWTHNWDEITYDVATFDVNDIKFELVN